MCMYMYGIDVTCKHLPPSGGLPFHCTDHSRSFLLKYSLCTLVLVSGVQHRDVTAVHTRCPCNVTTRPCHVPRPGVPRRPALLSGPARPAARPSPRALATRLFHGHLPGSARCQAPGGQVAAAADRLRVPAPRASPCADAPAGDHRGGGPPASRPTAAARLPEEASGGPEVSRGRGRRRRRDEAGGGRDVSRGRRALRGPGRGEGPRRAGRAAACAARAPGRQCECVAGSRPAGAGKTGRRSGLCSGLGPGLRAGRREGRAPAVGPVLPVGGAAGARRGDGRRRRGPGEGRLAGARFAQGPCAPALGQGVPGSCVFVSPRPGHGVISADGGASELVAPQRSKKCRGQPIDVWASVSVSELRETDQTLRPCALKSRPGRG